MRKRRKQQRHRLIRVKREKRAKTKKGRLRRQGKSKSLRERRHSTDSRHYSYDKKGRKRYRFIRDEERYRVHFPKVFSCIDDPETALSFIDSFRGHLSKKFIKSFHFDHSKCEVLGLDAQSIVDALAQEESVRRGKSGITIGGTYPDDFKLKVLLRAIGTLRMLGHPDKELPKDVERRIERCDRLYGSGKKLRMSGARDRAGTSIVDYFQRVLRHQGFEFEEDGVVFMTNLVTEVIGNAEEHSGRWYAIGYSETGADPKRQRELEECQLVIFNFGKTIFESLSARSASVEVKDKIQVIVDHHKKSKFFSAKWSEECLWTLAALQHGVSRYRAGEKGKTRGRGTIEMIRAFSELATKPQQMCVISGNTYILFDGEFELKPNDGGALQIAFNRQNDLMLPPEDRYVYRLNRSFPGTIISLRFKIDSEHLGERANHA